MVVNKIKEKILKPIVYRISKREEPEKEDVSVGKKEEEQDYVNGSIMKEQEIGLNEKELKDIRTNVLEEIGAVSTSQLADEKIKSKTKGIFTKDLFKKFEKKSDKNVALPQKEGPDKKAAAIKEKKSGKRISLLKINITGFLLLFLKAVILSLVFLLIITTIGIYLAGWQGDFTTSIVRIIPYPAAYVEGRLILIDDFLVDVKALESYLERNKIQYTTYDVRSNVMQSLIEKTVINNLAKQNNVVVTQEELEQTLATSVLLNSSKEQLDQLINELYGWDLEIYTEKIIKPLILTKNLQNYFNQTSGNLAVRQQMEDYYSGLLENPKNFENLAMEKNEDESKAVAGDLGWLSLGDLNPILELELLNLPEGGFGQIVETEQGYYIMKLIERIIDDDDGRPYFHASHIFLKKRSFQEYLSEEIKNAKVVTLIKI